jgi:hypothetical protein
MDANLNKHFITAAILTSPAAAITQMLGEKVPTALLSLTDSIDGASPEVEPFLTWLRGIMLPPATSHASQAGPKGRTHTRVKEAVIFRRGIVAGRSRGST